MRTSYTKLLLSRLLTALVLVVATLVAVGVGTDIAPAKAASVGTSGCASTVDDATGVAVTVATNGDCVISFATAITTGGNAVFSTRTWTVPTGLTSVQVLVVAGGGGGGSSNGLKTGGAGGGGGVVVATSFAVTPGAAVTVKTGAGGSGGSCSNGVAGGYSTFGTLTAVGGGWGSGCSATEGKGGSGGGGHYRIGAATTQATLGTASDVANNITAYGSKGGNAGDNYDNGGGGGGGGATQVGFNGTGTGATGTGGNGGEGIANSFRTGSSIVYGSGGGGGGYTTNGIGGTNGGNGCGTNASGAGGAHGVNETGGGGGGGWMTCTPGQAAGRGGSGIVVVRYAVPAPPKLATPTNILASATPLKGKSIDISWDAVTNAQSYIVKVKGGACGSVYGTKSGITSTSTTVTRFNMSSYIMGDNQTYAITVTAVADGVNYSNSLEGGCGLVTTNISGAIPTIGTQPITQYKTVGQSATLSVSATTTDSGVLSYQWYKAGVELLNAKSASLGIDAVSSSDSGSYTVEVFNTIPSGVSISAVSSAATLTIAGALTISTPTTGLSGTANSAFSLAVPGVGGRTAFSYALTGTLVNGLSLSTTTGTISGTPTVAGSSSVSVTVTDANNATASTSGFTISIAYASTTVSLALANSSPQYRITNRITATTSRAGAVNFMLGGVSITGCEAVAAASTTAVCDWVPIDLGVASLSATFTPTASTAYSSSTSSLSPTVGGRAITVTPTSGQTKVFGESDPVLTYTITSGSLYGVDALTGSLSRSVGSDAGAYSITAGNLYNSNYTITLSSVTFVISKADQAAVLLTSINGTYATDLALESSGGSGTGAYSYVVTTPGTAGCSITNGALRATSPGSCTVTSTRETSVNYFAKASLATTVTIGKATQAAVLLTSTSGTFNTAISLTASGGTSSGTYVFSVTNSGTAGCSVVTATSLTSTGAGSCTVTATRNGDNYYESRSSLATTVSFGKDTQAALSIRDSSGDLDAGITLATSGGSGNGSVSYSVTSGTASCSITNGVVNARNAGSCSLTATKATDNNYLQVQVTNTLTFVKATQSALLLTTNHGTYGVGLTLATSGGSGSGDVSFVVSDNGSADCVVNSDLLTFVTPGSCKVVATKNADSVFNARSSAATTVTIDKAIQSVLSQSTISGDLYTGIIIATTGGSGTGATTSSVTSGTANCLITSGVVTAKTAGTCALTIGKAGDANYYAATTTVTLTFSKAVPATGRLGTGTSGTAGSEITLSFTGGSGTGSVSYSVASSGTARCSITNGKLTASSAGTCSVTTTKQGDDVYPDQTVTTEFTFTAGQLATPQVETATASTTPTTTTTTTVAPMAGTKRAIVTTTTTTSTTSTTEAPKPLVAPKLVNTDSASGASTIGGKTVRAKTTRVNNQLVFTAGGFTVTLAGVNPDGSVIPLTSEGLLEVRRGDMFRLDATGFAPGSLVDIWMFSKTFHLTQMEVGPDGLVRSSLKVPKSITDGLHHLVMVGVDKANAEAKFEVGMNVGVPAKQWWYSRVLLAIPISFAVFAGFWLPTTARRKRRRTA